MKQTSYGWKNATEVTHNFKIVNEINGITKSAEKKNSPNSTLLRTSAIKILNNTFLSSRKTNELSNKTTLKGRKNLSQGIKPSTNIQAISKKIKGKPEMVEINTKDYLTQLKYQSVLKDVTDDILTGIYKVNTAKGLIYVTESMLTDSVTTEVSVTIGNLERKTNISTENSNIGAYKNTSETEMIKGVNDRLVNSLNMQTIIRNMNILNLTTNNEVDIYETKINGMKISSEQITKEQIQVNSGARYVHYTYLLDPKVLRLGGLFYVLKVHYNETPKKVPITVIIE